MRASRGETTLRVISKPAERSALSGWPPEILPAGFEYLRAFVRRHARATTLIGALILGIIGTYLAYRRYPYAFSHPNFYGEDGKIYTVNIYKYGFIHAAFTRFNGYLIFLQYVAVGTGMLLNAVVGHGLISLPKALAVVSYATLASVSVLPWLLFRRKLGIWISLLLFVLLVYVPLGGWDYTVIGTIGNIKFSLFFAAFLLVWYRNGVAAHAPQAKRLYAIDAAVLSIILTNITAAGLLLIGLLPYYRYLTDAIRNRSLRDIPAGLISLATLWTITLGYVGTMYGLGIPTMPGYLDGPLSSQGLLNTLFRGSWYGLLYPLYAVVNDRFVDLLLFASLAILLVRRHRVFGAAVLYAIIFCVVGFAYNRPGVTQYFNGFAQDGGPGQFFYGGSMIFIFGAGWLLRDRLRGGTNSIRTLWATGIFLYLVLALPLSGYGMRSYQAYAWIPDIHTTLPAACKLKSASTTIQIYPTTGWYMTLPHDQACKGVNIH